MKPYHLKVRYLMSTALITVRANELVTEAHAEMESGDIRHLPVVDDRGRLVGVLSDRDLLRTAAAKRTPRISEIMSREVVKVGPDAPAHEAAALMLEYKIGSVAVVDEDDALVGIVTQTDFLDLARKALLGLPLER
ncbi:MAG: CBS domain-containing protein [Myxococcales bacterium]|nr:CBS domain-containing protein [Myxococcales bacterium]